jgi:hypothetical protein
MRSEPSPELYPVVIESDRFVPGVLLVLSGGAAWYTFRGLLLEMSGRWGASITAAVVALVVGVALFTCWRTLLRQAALLPGAAWKAPPLMAVCLGFGIGTSGVFSFMGIEGPDAIRITMDHGVAAISTNVATVRRFVADNIGAAKAQIEAVQAKLDTSAASARDGSTISGGAGAVSGSYQQISAAAGTALTEIDNRVKQTEVLRNEINDDLAQLGALAGDAKMGTSDRFVRYYVSVQAIHQKIEALADLDVTSIVTSAQTAMSSIVPLPLSGKPEVAARQSEALDSIKAALPTLLTAKLQPRPTVTEPDTEFTMSDAVLNTWQHFVPVAVAIVLIEATPLFLLIMRLMATPHLSSADAIMHQTVGELLRSEAAMVRLSVARTATRPNTHPMAPASVAPATEEVEPTC